MIYFVSLLANLACMSLNLNTCRLFPHRDIFVQPAAYSILCQMAYHISCAFVILDGSHLDYDVFTKCYTFNNKTHAPHYACATVSTYLRAILFFIKCKIAICCKQYFARKIKLGNNE